MRLLVAEDADDVRELLSLLLGSDGHEVVAVEDGMGAVSAFYREHFDGVILDCSMPRMDGPSAAQVIRMIASLAPNPRPVRMAFLTGHFQSEEFKRVKESVGATRFWTKPVDAKSFLADVIVWLNE